MTLFGPVHLALIAATVFCAIALSLLCRTRPATRRPVRIWLGIGLIVNELIWWVYRYSHEGFRFPHNMPLQLCDVTLWMTALACVTARPRLVEFAYFAGIAGAGMAILTPDLWSPWPTYPAIYFFIAHGGIVAGAVALVWGKVVALRPRAMWSAFAILAGYAVLVGVFNAIFGTNYMYLCRKPANASLLDSLGPWPLYIAAGAAVALALFWLLWLPVRITLGAGTESSGTPAIPSRHRTQAR